MDQPTQAGEIINQEPTPVISPTPFAPKLLIAIVIILILIAGGIGIYILTMRKTQPVIRPPVATIPQSIPTPPTSPSANWKTYANQQLSLSFQYPSEWTVKEASLSANPEEMSHLLLDFSPAGGENRMLFGRLDFFDNPDNLSLMVLETKRAEIEISGMAPTIYSPTDQSVTIGKNIQGFIRKDAVCEPVICDIYTWQYKDKVFQLMHFKDFKEVPGQNELFNQILSTFRFADGSQSDSTAGWKMYNGNDFSFKYPATWIVEYHTGEGIIYNPETMFKGGNGGGATMYTEHLYFKILPSTFTATAYVDTMEKSEKTDPADPLAKEFSRKKILLNNSETETYHRGGEGTVGWYVAFANGIRILEIGPMDNEVTENRIENQILATFRFTQ